MSCAVLASLLLAAPPSDEKARKLAPFFRLPAELAGDMGKYRSPLLFDDGKPVRTPADWRKRRAARKTGLSGGER